MIPGLNIVGIFYELVLIVKDKSGMRLGDRLAKTQVVEGKESPELTKWVQNLLLYYAHLVDSEVAQKKEKSPV